MQVNGGHVIRASLRSIRASCERGDNNSGPDWNPDPNIELCRNKARNLRVQAIGFLLRIVN